MEWVTAVARVAATVWATTAAVRVIAGTIDPRREPWIVLPLTEAEPVAATEAAVALSAAAVAAQPGRAVRVGLPASAAEAVGAAAAVGAAVDGAGSKTE